MRSPGQPFPGNRIPADRINRNGQALLGVFPLPQPAGSQRDPRRVQLHVPGEPRRAQAPARLPLRLSGRRIAIQFYVRGKTWFSDTEGYAVPAGTSNWGLLGLHYTFTDDSLLGNWTRILSSSMVNELWVSSSSEEAGPPLDRMRGVRATDATAPRASRWDSSRRRSTRSTSSRRRRSRACRARQRRSPTTPVVRGRVARSVCTGWLRSTGAHGRSSFPAMDETSQPVELLLAVSRDGPGTLGAQIEDGVRRAIRDGALRPGTRVPSTRDLARQLGVSRRIVVDAYAQLAAEGYLRCARARAHASSDAATAGEPRSRRRRTSRRGARRASTSAPACPTSRPSRAPPGCARCGRRSPRSPTPTSATATRAASTPCARRSPSTSAACAAWSPSRRGSSSRAATRRGSASSASRSRPAARAGSRSRSPATPSSA